MDRLRPSKDGYFHPSSLEELRSLVLRAREERIPLRVRGAGHSVPYAIYADTFPFETAEYYAPSQIDDNYALNFQPVEIIGPEINILLDRFIDVEFFEEGGAHFVKACAGCHLGRDPYDPTETSTYFNSLFYQMDQRGFGVPDMGGITHQTVGGFLSTGSSGGSLTYSIEDAIVAFTFMDGNGEVHTCSRNDADTSLFDAIGVSMGLLGIITHVTFECIPRFDIAGSEATTYESTCEIDLFGNGGSGKPSLEQFLRQTEYTRLMWWPQKKVEKMVVWKAHRLKDRAPNDRVIPKPYQEVPWIFGSPALGNYAGDLFYTAIVTWPESVYTFIKNPTLAKIVATVVGWIYEPFLLPFVINLFVQNDDRKSPPGAQQFQDSWWRGLPMDNQMDDRLMPVLFTELWIPIEKTTEVMNALNVFYDKGGYKATGFFSNEIYGTKKSRFWMSPAYQRDVVRVDIFYFGKEDVSPYDFYGQYWDLLKPYSFRAHWAKYQPGKPTDKQALKDWMEYFRAQNPKWDDFMKLREKYDPAQIFVNKYWRTRLQIQPIKDSDYVPEPPPGPAFVPPADPDPTPAGYYAASLTWSLIVSAGVQILGSNVCGIFTWNSIWTEVAIIALMGLGIGVGNVWFRRTSPVLMMVLTAIVAVICNVINYSSGYHYWQWHPVMGIPTWFLGPAFEVFVSVFTAWFSRKLGQRFFPQHTAA